MYSKQLLAIEVSRCRRVRRVGGDPTPTQFDRFRLVQHPLDPASACLTGAVADLEAGGASKPIGYA